ncbi:MAG: polysaccharide pyruvyl transferase family protein [Burkholderiaceae bacterium]|nr:polysaccharide pyruvyl transferase family protein [Burkholderiaceae bacterium]
MQKLPFKSRLREYIRFPLLMREWKNVVDEIGVKPALPSGPIEKYLIIPCDQKTVMGSRGDEAMMIAMIQSIRAKNPNAIISLLTYADFEHPILLEYEIKVIPKWANPSWSLRDILAVCSEFDSIMIVGADTMDGHYSLLNSSRLWVVADSVARLGKISTILGFSFNSTPALRIINLIKNVSFKVNVLLRDPVSHGRFEKITGRQARCAADAAFQLHESDAIPQMDNLLNWIEEKKANNLKIIGFNVHPMLFDMSDPAVKSTFIQDCSKALRHAMGEHPISILLISHDFRGSNEADLGLLDSIYANIKDDVGDKIYLDRHPYSATELKFIAGKMDAVFSARMHLCIATLGMKKPVAVLTYQGKFEGLFSYFKLPGELMLDPNSMSLEEDIFLAISFLVDNLSLLTTVVNESWAGVKQLSALNTRAVTEINIE